MCGYAPCVEKKARFGDNVVVEIVAMRCTSRASSMSTKHRSRYPCLHDVFVGHALKCGVK